MFDQHDGTAPTGNDEPIWRFLDFSQFVDMLDRKALFFARIDTLGDPFAGSSDEREQALRTLPDEVMRLAEEAAAPPPPKMGRLERWWARKTQEGERDNLVKTIRDYQSPSLIWACCWNAAGADELMPLWKGYQAFGKQVAIRTTIGKLRAALAAVPDKAIAVDHVRYIDAGALGQVADPSDRALAKSRTLAFEREVRAILTRGGRSEGCLGRGCGVPVDLNSLIDEVAVSPAAEAWIRDLVRRVMRTYGLDETAAIDVDGRLALPDYSPDRALPSS